MLNFDRLPDSLKSEYDKEIKYSHPQHREVKPQNTGSYKTAGRQLKNSIQLSLTHQGVFSLRHFFPLEQRKDVVIVYAK